MAAPSGAWPERVMPPPGPNLKSTHPSGSVALVPANKPLWLRAVLRVERAVGEPIEAAVRSETYFDLVSTTTRMRRKVGGAAEGVSRRCLHLLNLPAGSDIRRLRQQLARME